MLISKGPAWSHHSRIHGIWTMVLASALLLGEACGGGAANGQPKPSPTAPTINPVLMACPPDTPSFLLKVPGTNFNSGSVLLVNGREVPTTYHGPNLVSAWINSQELAFGGSCEVKNASPTLERSGLQPISSGRFLSGYLNPTCSPRRVVAGAPAFTLAIWNVPVDDTSAIIWNGVELPTLADPKSSYASALVPASEVVSPGYSVASLYSRATGAITPAQVIHVTVDQQVAAMVESPTGDRLLAIVPDTGRAFAGRLISLDPHTGQINSLLAPAVAPTSLVVSGDGNSLYLGSKYSKRVDRLVWPSLSQAATFEHQFTGTGSLVALPGSSTSVVVGQTVIGSTQVVEIFDEGQPRAGGGSVIGSGDCLAVDETGTRVYALDNGLSSFELRSYAVDAVGLNQTGVSGALPIGFQTGIATWGGKVYTSNGLVIDSITMAVQAKRIPASTDSRFLLDPPNNRIYFFEDSGFYGLKYLMVYNLATLEQVGALPLPGMTGAPRAIVRWGANGLALVPDPDSGTESPLFLMQTDLVKAFY